VPDIARDSDRVEIDGPPRFDFGEKVTSRYTVRNDGTFRGKDIGEILVRKGDVGYVHSIGTFLQQHYIYGVMYVERGYCVGMKGRELVSLDAPKRQISGTQPDGD
jgi:nitrogen fixation protein NifZ